MTPYLLWQIVPVSVVVTVIIQTAFVLLWVGRAGARIDMMEARLEQQAGVAERLARLEEQAVAQRATLDRIESKLEARG
ncbi:hypothetical protein [Asticcacaulis sp. EMRT-3]|uniref:hypothetical protein n=1 Tax=Asticcacaulis sp. EMRT-3 TaxID=3040349 RepID=UPI0024AF38CE|nr:hypothetical protein [Asticcacaulis sp. EMRT-3]MDI7775388.1 hypothetical protein [Asticcacaulis sp. EMRT-3]